MRQSGRTGRMRRETDVPAPGLWTRRSFRELLGSSVLSATRGLEQGGGCWRVAPRPAAWAAPGSTFPGSPPPHVLGPKVRARDPGICVSTSSLGHLRVTEAGEALEREMGGSGKVVFTPSCRTRHRSPRPAGRPGPARGCLFPPLFSASPLMLVCIRLFLTEQMGRLRCLFI